MLQNKRWLGRAFALDPCLSKLHVSLFPISPVRSHQFALSMDSLKVVPPKDGYQMPVFPRLNSRFGFLGSCNTSDKALEPTLCQASRHGKQSRRYLLWKQQFGRLQQHFRHLTNKNDISVLGSQSTRTNPGIWM